LTTAQPENHLTVYVKKYQNQQEQLEAEDALLAALVSQFKP
jgi:hypothetical protein